jgi:hypothetical protein
MIGRRRVLTILPVGALVLAAASASLAEAAALPFIIDLPQGFRIHKRFATPHAEVYDVLKGDVAYGTIMVSRGGRLFSAIIPAGFQVVDGPSADCRVAQQARPDGSWDRIYMWTGRTTTGDAALQVTSEALKDDQATADAIAASVRPRL